MPKDATVRWPAFELRCPMGHVIIGGISNTFSINAANVGAAAQREIDRAIQIGAIKSYCHLCGAPRATWQSTNTSMSKMEAAESIHRESRTRILMNVTGLAFGVWAPRLLFRKALVAGNPGPDEKPIEPPVWPAVEVRCSNNHLINLVWQPGSNWTMEWCDLLAFHFTKAQTNPCPVCGDPPARWNLWGNYYSSYEGNALVAAGVRRAVRLATLGLVWVHYRDLYQRALPAGDVQVFWAIYDRPDDFPNNFVVRAHYVLPGNPFPVPGPAGSELVCTSLAEARARVPRGLMPIAAHPELDVKSLVETWV